MMRSQEHTHTPVLEEASDHVGQHFRETADHLRETVARARQELQEGLENIEKKFTEARDTVVHKTKQVARTTDRYVNKNPWKAVGISAGVAFLAGIIIARRRPH
ncbi:MAG TPA: DUF883 domain-containing protein [Bacteroidota bacterium]|jgi:ElaB/YqjD/DUF883 family membrane-anchored ribosome-binding protein